MSKDEDKAAKDFKTDSHMAGLYVYRNEAMGIFSRMDVYINGRHFVKTTGNTFAYTKLKPGKYELKGEAENSSVIEVNLKAGKNTYVWQEVKMGLLTPRNKLAEVSESEGKKGVLECERVQAGNVVASQ